MKIFQLQHMNVFGLTLLNKLQANYIATVQITKKNIQFQYGCNICIFVSL